MAGAAILCVEVDPSRIERRLETRYLDEACESLDDAVSRVREAASAGRALSVGLLGNAAEVVPELARQGRALRPRHRPDGRPRPAERVRPGGAVGGGGARSFVLPIQTSTCAGPARRSRAMSKGCSSTSGRGSYVFDYGNNLRGEALEAGVQEAFTYPGFVPAYIRPLFCRGVGPFRWAVLSGDPADIEAIDETLRSLFPGDETLQRWLELAPERVAFQGLPARICWLGLGERAAAGLAINELVRSGRVKAPVVIGRDHLDSGSVASPFRETEAMRDGSDAIADWPILNALVNVAAGATWVSVHHGGGVGIGNSIHAGMVVVADGTDEMAERLERVLTTDPATGVLRHVDAGYAEARDAAEEQGLTVPMRLRPRGMTDRPAAGRLLVRDLSQLATPAGRARATARSGPRPRRGHRGRLRAVRGRAYRGGGADARTCRRWTATSSRWTGAGNARSPASSTATPTRASAAIVSRSSPCAPRGATLRGAPRGRGRHPLDRPGDARGRGGRAARGGAPPSRLDAPLRARPRRRRNRATGSTARPSSPRCGRSAPRAASRRGWVRTRFRPSSTRRRHISTSCSRRCCPEAAELAEAADVFLERGAFDASQARRYLEACRAAGLALRLHGDQFTESGAIPLAIELGARSVDHLEATGDDGVRALADSEVVGVLLPASALFLARPMPPARALIDAGAAVALATDFNPGSAFCESLPLVCSLAATQLRMSVDEALSACTVNAAHVLGRADRKGRIAPGYDADLVLLDAPDWRYLAYHLGGEVVAETIVGGRRD